MIGVLLVDDHGIVRAGLERLLQQTQDIEVVGVADRGEDAIRMATELHPDVVLMDLSMPGKGGIHSTRRITSDNPSQSVVMLTASTDRLQIMEALDAGASGYLVKDAEPEALIDGIRQAAAGNSPMDARAARLLLDNRGAGPASASRLSPRETDVLKLVHEGLSNKAIARRLGISEATVKAHLTRVFSQLGVTDRTQAALWAHENL